MCRLIHSFQYRNLITGQIMALSLRSDNDFFWELTIEITYRLY